MVWLYYVRVECALVYCELSAISFYCSALWARAEDVFPTIVFSSRSVSHLSHSNGLSGGFRSSRTVEKSNSFEPLFKEGHSFESTLIPMDSMSAAASRGRDAGGLAVSQLNDYLHRGTHPLYLSHSNGLPGGFRSSRSRSILDTARCTL